MPRLLSLFDGTGSISRAFAGWDVQSLDIDGSHAASVVGDILTWDYHLEPTPDVLFAGCPCEHYSIANTRGKRNLTFADRLVARTWEVIQHFQAKNPALIWFIENPDSSLLWKRLVSTPFPDRVRLDFCQYGKPYRKRTKLATNTDFVARPLCNPKVCPACVDGRHAKSAQRGPAASKVNDLCSLDELHAYPVELCTQIFEHCCRRIWYVL